MAGIKKGRENVISALLHNPNKKPLLFAHRGFRQEYPENTILAFDMAIRHGAIGIETDLQFTKDHQIVCFHDRNLYRLTRSFGAVQNNTLKELSALRISHSHSPQPIPTLVELLEWLPADRYMILELKSKQFRQPKYMELLFKELAKYNLVQHTIIASFDLEHLRQARKTFPSILTSHITFYNFSATLDADILAAFYPMLWVKPSFITEAHQNDKFVSVWDSHPEKRIDFYRSHHVDILTGDNPKRMVESFTP